MSRSYGVVVPSFWTGSTGRSLRGDPDAWTVASYLVTGPQATMTGLYYLPAAFIAHDTGLGQEKVDAALAKLSGLDFVVVDQESEWVWVREMARFQIAEELKPQDKRVRGVVKGLAGSPDVLRQQFLDRYSGPFGLDAEETSCKTRNKNKNKDPSRGAEGAYKPLPENPLAAPVSLGASGRTKDIAEVFDHWRSYHPAEFMTPHTGLKEWRHIESRMTQDACSVETLKQAIDGIHLDDWKDRPRNMQLFHAVKSLTDVQRFAGMAGEKTHQTRIEYVQAQVPNYNPGTAGGGNLTAEDDALAAKLSAEWRAEHGNES